MPAGLSEAEARSRLLAEGPNELPSERRNSFVEGVLGVLREPMLLLLAGAAALYFVLGDVVEASILLFMVGVVFGITWVQERKTERALVALRDLTSPRANVIREGKRRRVPGHEVVRGDVVMLAEGDRVPADAVVRDATNLSVEESILTGESAPVRKVAAVHGKAPSDASPGGDALPFVFSGTLVVRGHGVVEVTATGGRTALGRVGMSLREIETERTPLEREVARAVRVVASLGALACVVLVVAYGISRGEWLEGLLAGIAFAMAILPEEMPMILAVFPALGAWRISKEGVLTRRTAAIEALGATTVLCTDKTGTLTENRMRIAELRAHGLAHAVGDDPLPEAVHEVVEFGILASQRDPFDPMEIAFHSIGVEKLSGTEHLHSSWELVREYPLEPPLLSISHVWRAPEGKRFVVAAKGAPETIVDLCHLPDEERAAVTAEVRELATKGLRVLAVARAYFEPGPLPESQHDFAFRMVGLVGLEDPIRAEVPAAVAECRGAGIRVVMITGDYAETARAVAERADFSHIDIVTGAELDALDDEALGERVRTANVYVRVIPEQKLRVVRALEAGGDVVAMTGDGVNDAPALKAAH
ncbi:MAG: HAD family hydrolase, partial [Myxococcales bacterium]|nr:HAD family hydrolase [Myxococcales bacterium]